MEALENVVQIQEQQLLGISSLGKAERPDVAAMLPKWRHETLRQFELRLRAQLSAKNAEAAFNSARGELEDQVQRAEASRAVRIRFVECCAAVARFEFIRGEV